MENYEPILHKYIYIFIYFLSRKKHMSWSLRSNGTEGTIFTRVQWLLLGTAGMNLMARLHPGESKASQPARSFWLDPQLKEVKQLIINQYRAVLMQ